MMKENLSEWHTYSTVYEVYYSSYKADVEFLERAWQPTWHAVLEVGAGTGRLQPFFQRQGVSRYVGLDTCPQMLDIARSRSMPPEFRLIEADMSKINLEQKYDLIVYAFNTANYILDESEFERHLSACASYLHNGGRVFLDLYVPFAITKGEDGDRYWLRERVACNGLAYELYDRRYYDARPRIEERHHKSVEIEGGCVRKEILFRTWRRYYSLDEIESLARRAGLHIHSSEEYGETYTEGIYVMLA